MQGTQIDLDDYWDGLSIRSVAINDESNRLYGGGQSSHYIFVFDLQAQKVISKYI